MRKYLTLAGLAAATLLAPQMAMAAPVTHGEFAGTRAHFETVRDSRNNQWRNGQRRDFRGRSAWRWQRFNRCTGVRHACHDRFRWGGWRYRRCVWRQGC